MLPAVGGSSYREPSKVNVISFIGVALHLKIILKQYYLLYLHTTTHLGGKPTYTNQTQPSRSACPDADKASCKKGVLGFTRGRKHVR